jgi:hypothetical protein
MGDRRFGVTRVRQQFAANARSDFEFFSPPITNMSHPMPVSGPRASPPQQDCAFLSFIVRQRNGLIIFH